MRLERVVNHQQLGTNVQDQAATVVYTTYVGRSVILVISVDHIGLVLLDAGFIKAIISKL